MIIEMPKQPRRSKREIAEEVQALDNLREDVPPQTVLGDDNQAAIDAQLKVLTECMNEEEVVEAFEEQAEYVLSNALDAATWAWGDGSLCSDDWAALAAMQAEALSADVEAASRD